MGVMGPFVGRIYDRRGARVLVIPGALLLCAALWGYATLGAILTTLQQVAGAAGTALFITVLTTASASGGAPDLAGVRAAFTVAAVIAVFAVAAAFLTGRQPAPPGVENRETASSQG